MAATTTNLSSALRNHPFLENLDPAYIEKLTALAFEVHFKEDQVIFREFDPSSFFYLITEGRVSLEISAAGRTIRILTIGPGEELGWSSLMTNVNKQFAARSLEPVTAIAFDGARVMAACEEDPRFGFIIMRQVLSTVSERLRATRLQVIDVYARKGYKPQ